MIVGRELIEFGAAKYGVECLLLPDAAQIGPNPVTVLEHCPKRG